MKVYITKYALTKGIQECEGQINGTGERYIFFVPEGLEKVTYGWQYKPDWHTSKERAIERAEQMRSLKIESLKKQLRKLENLKFEL